MSKKKKNQFPRFYPASPGTSCPTRGHPRSSLGVANTKVLVAQSCPTLCDPMDCSPPDSSSPGKNTAVGCHSLL